MSKFFSMTTRGFYFERDYSDYEQAGTWPVDAKQIDDATEALLRVALAKGDTIAEVIDGFVITLKPPEPLADVKARLADAVDDAIARIYAGFTRFSDEYRMREEEAKAFIAAGYTGTAGALVQGYAVTQFEMTDQQAAGIIIAQANALRSALTALGNLRMRKNEIKSASVLNSAAAQAIHDEIILLASAAVANL